MLPLRVPDLVLPPASLLLLTSVLGASSNWLVLHFVTSALSPRSTVFAPLSYQEDGIGESKSVIGKKEVVKVVLGFDLAKVEEDGRLLYVDGLHEIFKRGASVRVNDNAAEPKDIVPCTVLKDARLKSIERAILVAINSLGSGTREDVLLVLDGLDFLSGAIGVAAREVDEVIGELREHAYQTIVTASADYPLLQLPITPLETNHTALIIGLAHQANVVMALRMLDTGAARDVSGVLRITRGALWEGEEAVDEKELLYYVGGEGSVKTFSRGT